MKVIVTLSPAAKKSYIFTAVYHTVLDMIHHETDSIYDIDEDDIVFSLVSGTSDVLDELCAKEDYQRIVRAIEELPEIYAEILSLYYLCEFSFSEIAKQFQIKKDTVRKRFYRGRSLLIQLLREGS